MSGISFALIGPSRHCPTKVYGPAGGENHSERLSFHLLARGHCANYIVLQIMSCAVLGGYVAAEYVWPFVKRHLWTRSELQRRLQV